MPDPDPGAKARVHLWVQGHVQGVGFRAFVINNALLLGLKAWARNVGYDRVEIAAEGPRPVLEKFAGIVVAGPRASRVDESSIEWQAPTGRFDAADSSTD
jgi:acylphosphatase